jgi:hypothetical protein
VQINELIYRIAGELEDTLPAYSTQEVLFVTADGQCFEPVAVVSDGELTIINIQPALA